MEDLIIGWAIGVLLVQGGLLAWLALEKFRA